MNTKDKIAQARERIKELEVMIDVWESTLPKKKFGDKNDQNRNKAFIDKLLLHKIKVYRINDRYVVPINQAQSRMVKNFFETYEKYVDSVFYDASSWSVSNIYNMKSKKLKSFKVIKESSAAYFVASLILA